MMQDKVIWTRNFSDERPNVDPSVDEYANRLFRWTLNYKQAAVRIDRCRSSVNKYNTKVYDMQIKRRKIGLATECCSLI